MVSQLDILRALAGKLANEVNDPYAMGPLGALPAPVKRVLGVLPGGQAVIGPGAHLGSVIAKKAGDNDVGNALMGAVMVANARANPLIRAAPTSPGARMVSDADLAFRTAPGHLGQRLLAAQAAGGGDVAGKAIGAGLAPGGGVGAAASANSGEDLLRAFAATAGAATLDPMNLLGPLGKGLEATKLARIGAVLEAVDRAQNLPLEQLAAGVKAGGGRVMASQLARRLVGEAIPTAGKAGSIPLRDIPKVGGLRQFGPVPPPPSGVPVQLPLGAATPPLPPLSLPEALGGATSSPGLPTRTSPLEARVAALVGARPMPREVIPAMGPIPLPQAREAKLAQRVGALPGGRPPQAAPAVADLAEALPTSAPAPSRLVPDRAPRDIGALIAERFGPPAGAVTAAEERATGDLGPLSDELGPLASLDFPAVPGGVGGLTSDEVDTLVRVAYPGDTAQGNALNAHPDPEELAQAALSRIRGSNRLLATLSQADDALARKVAYLPEPGEVAGEVAPAVAQAVTPTADPRAAFDDLIASRDDGNMGRYLPSADFFAKRLGIPIEEAQRYIDDLVARGVVGDAGGALAFRPGARASVTPAVADVAEALPAPPSVAEVPTVEEVMARVQRRGLGRMERSSGQVETWDKILPEDLAVALHEAGITRSGDSAPREVIAKRFADLTPQEAALFFGERYEVGSGLRAVKKFLSTLQAPPTPLGGDIAAGGGGGGLGILPYAGGLTGPVGRAILPATGTGLAGMGIGAAVGAATDDEDRLGGALKGGLVGAGAGYALGAGAGLAGPAAARKLLPEYWQTANLQALKAGVAGQKAGLEASTGNLLTGLKAIPSAWRMKTTQHARNLIGDEGWGRAVVRLLQGKEAHAELGDIRRQVVARRGATNPFDREPDVIQQLQGYLGRPGVSPVVGDHMAKLEDRVLSATDTMIAETALSVLNPKAVATNVLGLGAAAVQGAARPGIRAWFESLSDFIQSTFRRTVYADEATTGLKIAAEKLLPQMKAAGVDISGLAPDGKFTTADVRAVGGQQWEDRWSALVDAVREGAEDRTMFMFGDYRKLKDLTPEEVKRLGPINRLARKAEGTVGGAVPFMSWLTRAYPVGIAMLAQHPAIALGLYHYLQATKPDTEGGQPAYTAGMVPIGTDAPVIGAILKAYTGGQDGTVYADPLGAISPFGGDLVKPAEETGDKNAYQQATGWLERLGLPGVNPAIQAAAYATGLDYKAPGSTSRTKGLEEALALVPGNPSLPNVGPALLAKTRSVLSPALEGVVPGVEGDKYAEPFDPITRRYAELVMQETKKPLNDPANSAYLAAIGNPDNALMQRARQEVLLGGAAQNVVSLTAPVGLIAQSDPNKAYKAAATGTPFSYERVQGAKASSPLLADLMAGANEQYTKKNPAVATYKVQSTSDAKYQLLREWEAAHKDYLFVVGPTIYARERRKVMEQLGLVEPKQP